MISSMVLFLVGCDAGETMVGFSKGSVGVACADTDGALSSRWASELDPMGCRWQVQAVDGDGTMLLTFDVPAFVDASEGTPVSTTYTLPDDTVRLELDLGCGFAAGMCGGEDSGITPSVSTQYTPTAGTIGLEITPDGDEADAVVTFTGVSLVSDTGETTTLDGVSWNVRMYGL